MAAINIDYFKTARPIASLSYRKLPSSEVVNFSIPLDSESQGDVKISIIQDDHERGLFLNVALRPAYNIELVAFFIEYDGVDISKKRMMANGYQSWSQSKEMDAKDRILNIPAIVARVTHTRLQGDYDIFPHTGECGLIHSSVYTYFREPGSKDITFLGSDSESTGYTYFQGDLKRNKLRIHKECLGKKLDAKDTILLRVFIAHGSDEAVMWDDYMSLFEEFRVYCSSGTGDATTTTTTNTFDPYHATGWTSWYNYYGRVTERDVLDNLNAMKEKGYPIDFFQVDDGYQTAVGDWLSINKKFPSNMKPLTDKIKAAGYKPGLWLAPFAVATNSQLAKDYPEYLVRDNKDELYYAGPNWGGFYALDIYYEGVKIQEGVEVQVSVKDHLKKVFDTVLREWDFSMVKLDFLFATAMVPRRGKSRGEIMWDAIVLLRELVGSDRFILGCGTPLAPVFRRLDYCRIGSDVGPFWDDTTLRLANVRERVATANSLVSTLNRWQLGLRASGSDPDVVILRNTKDNKLTKDERVTLGVLNNVLGSLVFMSDNVSTYGSEEHAAYAAMFPKVAATVQYVREFREGVYVVRFRAGGRDYTIYANLSSDKQTCHLLLPDDEPGTRMYFARPDALYPHDMLLAEMFFQPKAEFKLRPHQTLMFYHVPIHGADGRRPSVTFLGSTGHIVPGTEIANVRVEEKGDKEGIHIQIDWQPKKVGVSTVLMEVVGAEGVVLSEGDVW
ncbi:glycoside hydrolase superfamily, partial [Jimgerdemannia flammicorona]